MRQIQVLVPDDRLDAVTDALDDEGIDYVRHRAWTDGDEQWLVEVPVPTDAIGYVRERLDEAGVEPDRYTVVASLESAMTPRSDALRARFADDFDPLSTLELRSKAGDMSRDPTSFVSMIFLSAIIATAGLLVGSPAIVVGSMVIAPIVGPVLTATTGAATGDREMLLHSVWLQAVGLGTAIVGATLFGAGLQLTGFVPATLDITTLDLIAVRIVPTMAAVAVGLAAGAAGAFGLATKGPTSLIGVMIAAALIPAAATVGIAAAWSQYRVAVGALLLLVLTMVLINVGAFVTLWQFGYRPDRSDWLLPSSSSNTSIRRAAVVATVATLLVVVALVGVASYQQLAFERAVNQNVERTLDEPEYASLEPVSARTEYSGVGPFGSPETVTVTVSRTGGGDPPQIADELERRITEATGHDVVVRVRFETFQRSDDASRYRSKGNSGS